LLEKTVHTPKYKVLNAVDTSIQAIYSTFQSKSINILNKTRTDKSKNLNDDWQQIMKVEN